MQLYKFGNQGTVPSGKCPFSLRSGNVSPFTRLNDKTSGKRISLTKSSEKCRWRSLGSFFFLENAFDDWWRWGRRLSQDRHSQGVADFIWTHPLDGCRKQLPHCPSSQTPIGNYTLGSLALSVQA